MNRLLYGLILSDHTILCVSANSKMVEEFMNSKAMQEEDKPITGFFSCEGSPDGRISSSISDDCGFNITQAHNSTIWDAFRKVVVDGQPIETLEGDGIRVLKKEKVSDEIPEGTPVLVEDE